MCLLCDFDLRGTAEIHRPGPFAAFLSDQSVVGSGSAVAAEQGESRSDAPDNLSTTYAIAPGDTFEGFIGADDVDVIRLDITESGNQHPFEIGVYGFGEGTLEDPYLELLDETGAVIATNDDFTQGNTAAVLLHESYFADTYYLRVGGAAGNVGGYQISVTEDIGDTWIYSTDFSIYGREVAFLSPGDIDYYEVDGYFTDTPWTVSAFGEGDFALEDVTIKVFEGFTEIASNVGTGLPLVTFNPTRDTTHRIETSGGTAQSTGYYEIASMPDPVGSTDSYWFIEPDYYYNFHLTKGDTDWVYVDLTGGDEYTFEMYGLENDDLDPHIAIYDEQGTLIAENDDESDESSDAFLRYTPQTDERVFVETKDASGLEYGYYGVSVTDVSNATPVNAITWQDAALETDDPVKVWFAPNGSFVNDTGVIVYSQGFTFEQRSEFMAILGQVSEFANITFEQVGSKAAADIQVAMGDLDGLYDNDFLGRANPQGSTFYSDGTVVLDDDHWNAAELARGGFMNHVIAHEFGHALGLAHPHDYGGGSRPMLGVRDDADLGDFNLNQVPFTAMTYNDYWTDAPLQEPSDLGRGFLWGFGSLDIAALQAVYGTNAATRTGNDRYVLGQNGWLETIWDPGGTDEMFYGGRQNVTFDLRAASTGYDALGGGAVSYLVDGYSGFVIADNVTIENAIGGFGWDSIYGNAHSNRLEGRNGFDTIHGGSGNDEIFGGRGADTLSGEGGEDVIRGEGGSDTISGGFGNDTLYGDKGQDTLRGEQGQDELFGGLGADRLYGDDGDDMLDGGDDDDLVLGGAGDDTLYGKDGNDTLKGEDDHDVINGGNGSDSIWGGRGNDTLYGGDGNDEIRTEEGLNWADGGLGNDYIVGGYQADILYGGDGNDVIGGNGGDDILYGGAGRDRLSGNEGVDTLYGGDGDDELDGWLGNDVLFGGAGNDDLDGYRDDDVLWGQAGDDTLSGGSGNDRLLGNGGLDMLYGGDGDDELQGGTGDDYLEGGDGRDDLYGGGDNDVLVGGAGQDGLFGGDGNDEISGQTDHDRLEGGTGDDSLYGNKGNDDLTGGVGNDILRGGDGNDRLIAGAGNDALFGEAGFDELIGGAGDDFLNGGRGGGEKDGATDVFYFGLSTDGHGGFDRIRDFENGLDLLDFGGFGFSDFSVDVLPLAEARNAGADLALVMEAGYVIYIDNFTLAEFDASDVLI